jgi:hypothetical protein
VLVAKVEACPEPRRFKHIRNLLQFGAPYNKAAGIANDGCDRPRIIYGCHVRILASMIWVI